METDTWALAGGMIGGLCFYLALGGAVSLVGRMRDVSIRASWSRRMRRRPSQTTDVRPPYDARDVSAPSRVRRAQARRASAGRIVAAMVATTGLVGLTQRRPGLMFLVPAGAALGLVLPRALPRLAHGDAGPFPERPPRRLRLRGLRVSSVLPWLISLGAGILGIVFLSQVLIMNANPSIRDSLAMQSDKTAETYESTILALFLLCFVVAGASHRVARKLAQRNATELMAKDRRAPCLLLRSFADDRLKLFSSRSLRHGFLERLGVRRTERFEELLAWALQAYGPVIAVAEPGKRSRPLGAAREQIRDPDWLAHVEDRLTESGHVVVVAGQTDGLKREVETIRDLGLLDRTIFVLPPAPGAEASQRWDAVALTLGIDLFLDDADVGTVLVTVGEGTGVVYQGGRRDDVTYETAIDLALSPAPGNGARTAEGPQLESGA